MYKILKYIILWDKGSHIPLSFMPSVENREKGRVKGRIILNKSIHSVKFIYSNMFYSKTLDVQKSWKQFLSRIDFNTLFIKCYFWVKNCEGLVLIMVSYHSFKLHSNILGNLPFGQQLSTNTICTVWGKIWPLLGYSPNGRIILGALRKSQFTPKLM